MKVINANISCVDFAPSQIDYTLFSEDDSFRIIRTGFPKTRTKMTLSESIEFLLSDIRNLRAVRYFNDYPQTPSKVISEFNEGEAIKLPEVYEALVDKLTRGIKQGETDFVVLPAEGVDILVKKTIYFDNAFLFDIKAFLDKSQK